MNTNVTYETVENLETFERMLARVREAQKIYASYTQEQVDKIFRAAAMAAKNITEHRENVIHRHSAAESAEWSTVSGCSAHSCMTKLVVAGTFIRVAQYVVSFGCFFKLFFRFLVTRIFVRMILDGFFPVCFLYFFDC